MIDFPNLDDLYASLEPLEGGTLASNEEIISTTNAVWSCLRRQPMSDQWTALISIALDVGFDTIGPSELMRRFNAGDDARVDAEFHRWDDRGAGEARREAERVLFGYVPPPPEEEITPE